MLSSKIKCSLQDYEVLNVVGSGSFGTCYKVRNTLTDDVFVWKAIDYSGLSEEKKKLLCNEVNRLSEMNHPYIVKYFSRILHKETTTLYIIMEWCQGGDLSALINQTIKCGKFIEEWYIWRVVYQLSRALEYLHYRHSLAHRDMKAANVFLDAKGNAKLGDFGLSCSIDVNSDASPQALTVGTLLYVSPEILKGERYNFKSDIWSLGCLMYEMCVLRPPFHGVSMAQIISNIKAARYQRVSGNYSESLIKIIDWMLTVEIKVRPSSRVIARHPSVVANQITTSADLTIPFIFEKPRNEKDRHDIAKRLENVTLYEDPEDVSKKIFRDKWLVKLESVRSREAKLREKADRLVIREHSLDRREKNLALLERKAKEKMERARVYLNQCKESKGRPLKDVTNDDPSYSGDPNDSIVPQTVAKLDPLTLSKPNFWPPNRSKHVHFQEPTTKFQRNSTELSYFQVCNTGNENKRQTTLIKGLRYSSCQIISPSKENKPTETIKRNSISRLSMRNSKVFV